MFSPRLRRVADAARRIAFLLCAVIFLSGSPFAPGRSVPSQMTSAGLNFTSAGHRLAFYSDKWAVSNGLYALGVTFRDANRVMPVSSSTDKALERVTYHDLWDGIELSLQSTPRGIVESIYRIAPGADANDIALKYSAPLQLKTDGTLSIHFATGRMTESAPEAWQEIDGTRVPVAISFLPRGEHDLTFALGNYDHSRELYIDPALNWNTFLGSSANDAGNAIAVDSIGNVYVVGNSDATWGTGVAPQGCVGCPKRPYTAKQDVFVAKLDTSGNLVWMTFLGGAETDAGTGVAVDAVGNVYVSGNSGAPWGSPVRPFDFGVDTFAAKLDGSGNLVWNTFLGGRFNDLAGGIAVDSTPNVYVTGTTNGSWGTPVRAYSASDDGFAVKLDGSTGALTWNTFLGGSDIDSTLDIAVDGTGTNIYVGGSSGATWGTGAAPQGCAGCPLRAFSVANDAYAAKLSAGGGLVWNTFLGGTGNDSGGSVAVDGTSNVYLAGTSDASWGSGAPPQGCPGCPIRPFSSGNDTFALKLSSAGGLLWNTFLGGAGTDLGSGIAVNNLGTSIYVAGASTGTWGAPFRAFSGGGSDTFAAVVNSAGFLTWNGFLGGSGTDSTGGIAADVNGNVYLAGSSDASWGTGAPPQGCTGCPIRAYTSNLSSPVDAYAAKITNPTTAVNVAHVRAIVNRAGDIVIKWQSMTEAQIAGYDIFRKQGGKKSDWVQINTDLIPAKYAGAVAGAKYQHVDRRVHPGQLYRYTIRVLYLDGHSERTHVVRVVTP